jgi:GxxExxY protein
MQRDLRRLGRQVDREVPVMIYYRGEPLAEEKMDMVVDRRVVVEAKATERLHPMASTQLFGHLCATDFEVGLLLHFGHTATFHRVIFENRLKLR